MSDPIKVTVSDPTTGEVFEERVIDNDYVLLCAGDRYLSGARSYGNGTHVLTVKRGVTEQEGAE